MKNFLAISTLIAFVLLSTNCNRPHKTEIACDNSLCWENLIQAHLKRYPLLQMEDLYKLLYQSTLGNGHAISDSAEASEWLDSDLQNLSEKPYEPLADTLGSCGRFARVHLKTFIQYGGDPRYLLQAFLETSVNYLPDSSNFFCALSAAHNMAQKGKLPWSDNSLDEFISDQAKLHYPAVHHSQLYDSTYHPAYRVISIKLLPDLFNRNGNKVANVKPGSIVSASGPELKGKTVINLPKRSDS